MRPANQSPRVNFQIHLNEIDNSIDFHYGAITDTDDPTISYAVGIKTKSDFIAKERITPNTGI